ncbi:MAG: ABC transporter permease [Bacteriovorax sp.]|nr:ABC transporter permease [Bacteriovorax sp.]
MLNIANINKSYKMGDTIVYALRDVSLTIEDGDYVAIMGPSGSGKSTLMHILGLLDVPSEGSYKINEREVSHLSEDDLAILRRETIGFIFQQFNLLPRMSALENVTLPLLYSRLPEGTSYGTNLLDRTGLGTRIFHKPNELSGGQQQRVAIARSLINRPQIIFADEPTGNLDSVSEKEILAILKELNEQGITVVIVTHEEEVGQQAKRLIRMRDGSVLSDERMAPLPEKNNNKELNKTIKDPHKKLNILFEAIEYLKLGFKTLAANKVRTGLSMLGILIGVAAVIAMLAIGRGAQKAIETQLSSLGSNLLVLRPGAVRVGGVSQESGTTTRLSIEDSQYIKDQLDFVKYVSSNVSGRGQVAFQNKNWSTQILGGSASYALIHSASPEIGRFYTEIDNQKRARVAVIGMTVVREVFGKKSPIGEMIKINRVNFQVIGILPEKGANGFRDQDDVVVIPVLTAMHRLLGKDYVDSIDLEITAPDKMELAEDKIIEMMNTRHRVPLALKKGTFEIRNMADIQAAVQQSSQTMSLLLSSIAAISLIVGGIGIMNIMLVSVTERTREIGLRKAIGARRWDILAQFLAESVVVSAVGGVIGIILGWLITVGINYFSGWSTSISPSSVILSFFFSASIGVIFGIYPARKASLLNPIDALRHE